MADQVESQKRGEKKYHARLNNMLIAEIVTCLYISTGDTRGGTTPEEVRHAYQSMYVRMCTHVPIYITYTVEGYKERFDELECS